MRGLVWISFFGETNQPFPWNGISPQRLPKGISYLGGAAHGEHPCVISRPGWRLRGRRAELFQLAKHAGGTAGLHD